MNNKQVISALKELKTGPLEPVNGICWNLSKLLELDGNYVDSGYDIVGKHSITWPDHTGDYHYHNWALGLWEGTNLTARLSLIDHIIGCLEL